MATNNSDGSTPSLPTPAIPAVSSAPKAKATPSAKKPAAKKPTAAQQAPTTSAAPAAKTTTAKTTAVNTPAAKPASAKPVSSKTVAAKTTAAKPATTTAVKSTAVKSTAAKPTAAAAPAAALAASTSAVGSEKFTNADKASSTDKTRVMGAAIDPTEVLSESNGSTPSAAAPSVARGTASTPSAATTSTVPPAVPTPRVSNDPYAAPSGTPIAGYEGASTPGQAPFTPVPAGPPQGLSIASMVTGISGILLSFVVFGFLPGVAAVVMGHMAQKKQPYARPFWLTGLITGYISAAIGLITGVIVIGFFLVLIAGLGGASSYYDSF